MGCIFLKFSIWYHGVPKFIEKFTKRRPARDITLREQWSDRFFTTFKQDGKLKARVKDAVKNVSNCPDSIKREFRLIRYHQEIFRKRVECSLFFRDLLELVDDSMLVVNPRQKASGYNLDPQMNDERLYPHASRKFFTSNLRRYSQSSTLQKSELSSKTRELQNYPVRMRKSPYIGGNTNKYIQRASYL